MDQIWVKRRLTDGDDSDPGLPAVFGRARPAAVTRHPIKAMSPERCTVQFGVPGPWHERLPHFRLDHTPSVGDELQSELFVAASDAVSALTALLPLRDRIGPVIQVMEIRAIAADEIWLSPAYRRDSVAFHFTWVPEPDAVVDALGLVETALDAFEVRPHWGKIFTMPPDLVRSRYPAMRQFSDLTRSVDPDGVFRNDFLDTYLGAD
jgi:xylitol oxidase